MSLININHHLKNISHKMDSLNSIGITSEIKDDVNSIEYTLSAIAKHIGKS